MTTLEVAAAAMGAGAHAHPLEVAALRFGILRALDKAHFLAQVYVESAGFTRTRENLNYSVAGLRATFGRHRITDAECARYGRTPDRRANQEAIANAVYGGAWGAMHLGNTEPGDGWRFIGRGDKQITGRDNYTACSLALFGDKRLLDSPELLELLPYCTLSAGWYWKFRGISKAALRDDVERVTELVNGGRNGLDERIKALRKAKRLLGVA